MVLGVIQNASQQKAVSKYFAAVVSNEVLKC